MKFKTFSLFAIGCLILPVVSAQVPAAAPLPNAQPTDANYRLQIGDVVDVRFFFNPDLNEQNVQIRPDGCISLQLVGDVVFAGGTVAEVGQRIEAAYAKELKRPRVTIQVRGFATLKAFVSGEVHRPGTVSISTSMTLLGALGEAGGISTRGNRNRVVLIRKKPDGTPQRQEVTLFAQGQPTVASLAVLQPFDVILVPESSIAKVDRWVDQYIRQLIPVNMNAGFTYLWQKIPLGSGGAIVPPF
jgi:protein involved in polysaccharide export with SLBB domain